MKHRLFLAIDVPPATRQEIFTLQHSLDRLHLPITWHSGNKLHMTLNFLGSVPEENIGNIQSRISPIVQSYPQFTLTPYFLETLYNRHAPSLIYLAPMGDVDILKSFQKDLRSVFNDMRLPQANRFLPHITIGAFGKADPNTQKQYLEQVNDFPFHPLSSFVVDHVTLYESLLSRQGSTFQKVDKIVLK